MVQLFWVFQVIGSKCGKELIESTPRGLSDTLPHGGENDG